MEPEERNLSTVTVEIRSYTRALVWLGLSCRGMCAISHVREREQIHIPRNMTLEIHTVVLVFLRLYISLYTHSLLM
jgi:hypothetical protein